jgi:hypothetical protein
MITLIATNALRNHLNRFNQQEYIIEKRARKFLTTSCLLTLVSHSFVLLALLHPFLTSNASGQDIQKHPCLTGPSIAVQQLMQAPFEQPIQHSLISLMEMVSEEYQIPIWCDRSIPKDALIQMDSPPETLGAMLDRALDGLDASVVPLDGALMIVPKSKQDVIEAAHWKIVLSPVTAKLNRLDPTPFRWAAESEAAPIIAEYLQRFSIYTDAASPIEHDIWRAFDFRKSTPATIGLCLLSGFDQCLVVSDQQIQAGALMESTENSVEAAHVTWNYPRETLKRIGEERWREWRSKWPSAIVTKGDAGIYEVKSTVASHRALVQSLVPVKKFEKKPDAVAQYSGKLAGELEGILRAFAAKAKLDIAPLPLPPKLGSKTIEVNLNKATVDEALQLIGKQAGIEFRRNGKRVEIVILP